MIPLARCLREERREGTAAVGEEAKVLFWWIAPVEAECRETERAEATARLQVGEDCRAVLAMRRVLLCSRVILRAILDC